MKRGCPTGAAMPLYWSHAEYVSLVRSRHDGVCFDRVEPAFQRYVVNPVQSRYEIWTLRHPLRRVPHGKILRIILATEATVVWSIDGWAHTNKSGTTALGKNLWFTDFSTAEWVARLGVCAYAVLETRLALARPRLAGKHCMKTNAPSRSAARVVALCRRGDRSAPVPHFAEWYC
jgi:hypothetical protein